MAVSNPEERERTELLARLRRLRDHVISQADLVATPHCAYEPLPAAFARQPATILNGVWLTMHAQIEGRLLGLPAAEVAFTSAVGWEDDMERRGHEPSFAEVADRFRLESNRMLTLLDEVDLDQPSAHEVWIPAEGEGAPDVHRRVPARWLLLDLLETLARTAGELRTYFDLAQSGALIDVED